MKISKKIILKELLMFIGIFLVSIFLCSIFFVAKGKIYGIRVDSEGFNNTALKLELHYKLIKDEWHTYYTDGNAITNYEFNFPGDKVIVNIKKEDFKFFSKRLYEERKRGYKNEIYIFINGTSRIGFSLEEWEKHIKNEKYHSSKDQQLQKEKKSLFLSLLDNFFNYWKNLLYGGDYHQKILSIIIIPVLMFCIYLLRLLIFFIRFIRDLQLKHRINWHKNSINHD